MEYSVETPATEQPDGIPSRSHSRDMNVRRFWSAVVFCLPTLLAAQQPERIRSANTTVPITRVTKLVNMVDRDGLTINVAIQDLGGTTDVSPTHKVFLTLFLKGEMFNVDAAFELGNFFQFLSAKRTAPGLYEIRAITTEPHPRFGAMPMAILQVDARQATVDIRAVTCGDDGMDCPAAERFKTSITVTRTFAAPPPR